MGSAGLVGNSPYLTDWLSTLLAPSPVEKVTVKDFFSRLTYKVTSSVKAWLKSKALVQSSSVYQPKTEYSLPPKMPSMDSRSSFSPLFTKVPPSESSSSSAASGSLTSTKKPAGASDESSFSHAAVNMPSTWPWLDVACSPSSLKAARRATWPSGSVRTNMFSVTIVSAEMSLPL